MVMSFTEVWFTQASAEAQRMKLLLWLRRKCVQAGYSKVRILGRSMIGKPADASDYVLIAECEDFEEYFRLLDVIAGLTEGMQKRFVEAGAVKWGESIFYDLAGEKPAKGPGGSP